MTTTGPGAPPPEPPGARPDPPSPPPPPAPPAGSPGPASWPPPGQYASHPYATPAGWAPATPSPRRRTWIAVLVGVLLLLVALVTADVTLVVSRIKPVVDDTNEVLAAVRDGNYRLARSLSCSRDGLSSAAYAEFWRSLEQAKGAWITGYDVNLARVDGNHARVDYDLTFFNGRTVPLTVDAYHERGRWRPCLP